MAEVTLTAENFEELVLKASGTVLVDFWAAWCGPCRMVGPVLSQIAAEREGQLVVGKVNVDEEQQLAAKYNIMSIPTIMIFKDGVPVTTSVGAKSKEALEELL